LHLFLLCFHHGPEVALQLAAVVVVCEAIEVEEVPFQRGAGLLGFFPCDRGIALIKAVAVVPGVAVGLPRPHALPAKLVAADMARHVVAAAILLDRCLALGALLRVGGEPIAGLPIAR
jgi:hypothetical protein